MEARTIITTPGIGDILFVFQKLINQPEKFHWRIWDCVNRQGIQAQPRRGHQVFDLFPQLTESFETVPNAGYNTLKRKSYSGSWATAPRGEFVLEANSHLEAGKRIEGFLPDLEPSFILPFATTKEDRQKAIDILPDDNYIGIYTTKYENALGYPHAWLAPKWLEFIRLIQRYHPKYKFVFIGAHYDKGISQQVMANLDKGSYVNTIGDSEETNTYFPVVVEMLKRLDCFIGFQSGLSITNELIGAKRTIMLYSHALEDMMNTWPDEKRINSGAYKGCTFGTDKDPLTPQKLFDATFF